MIADLAKPIIGALAAAFIALAVYLYRSKITFELTSIKADLKLAEKNLSKPDDNGRSQRVAFERLTLVNRGWQRLNEVELHLEGTSNIVMHNVESGNISPEAILISQKSDYLTIAIPEFPSKAEIEIEYVTLGSYGGAYRRLLGTRGTYKIVEERRDRVVRSFISWMLWYAGAISFGFVIGMSGNA